MRRPMSRPGEQGFSLMELLVAMFVTLIVSGAVYGLIASGQTAFRREPELADRQQNIRIAMDLIQRDVLLAGQGIPWFGQAFTRTDLGAATGACPVLNGCGTTPGTLGGAAAAARAGGLGDPSEVPDVLEMVASEEQCPYYTVCSPGAGTNLHTSNPIVVREPLNGPPACLQGQNLLLAMNNYNFAVLAAPVASAAGVCPLGGGTNQTFTTTGAPVGSWVPYPGPNVPALQQAGAGGGAWITQARIARYEIAADPLDNNAPSLWRSTTGLFNSDGSDAGRAAAGVGTWQLVARGIEDLQVEYMDGNGAWLNSPPALTDGAETCGSSTPVPSACLAEAVNITRQVRVTLSARSLAVNLPGQTLDGNGTPGSGALRGQLQALITPRAAKVGTSIP